MKRKLSIILAVLVLLTMLLPALVRAWAEPAAKAPLSIAFTHDMHSHLDATQKDKSGSIASTGGFARLSTLIKGVREAYPQTLVLDAGDFSMGTLYQTIFRSAAPELVLMGAMGYDAVTLGNHEFDYRALGLADMLGAAKKSGQPLPQLLCANIDYTKTLNDPALAENARTLFTALSDYGLKPYVIMERAGYRIALFGLNGKESASFSPLGGLTFADPIASAKEIVQTIEEKEQADIIICLSHSGTKEDDKESEDELLAKAVPQIDVIISGHSHTELHNPLIVGDTIIVSGGAYTDYLGHLEVTQKEGGRFAVQQYGLLPLDESVADDESILLKIAAFRKLVNEEYLSGFGYTMGETIAKSTFSFTPIDLFGDEPGEDTLGNLIADSYIHAADAAGQNVDLAVVPAGVVRGSFSKGPITVDDVFKVSSLGIGADGVPGYPLVTVYLTGRELWDLCEVDASVSLLMEDARLYTAGLRYAFNPGRLFLNRVTEVYLENKDGTLRVPKNDELYCVIGGLYSTQMLGSVKEKSFGLLSIVPKDKDGKPIEDFEAHILYKGAAEYKEWVALADYMASFEKADGVPFVPQRYAAPVGIKTIQTGRSLADILKRPNKVFFILCGAVLAVLLVISLIVWLIVRLSRRRRRRRAERAEAA